MASEQDVTGRNPAIRDCLNCAHREQGPTGQNCWTCVREVHKGGAEFTGWTPAVLVLDDIPASDRMVSRTDNGGPALDDTPRGTVKVTSDGGSSTYYFLPAGATELNDLIEFKEMSFARGNIFKALYRLGEKAGIDTEYDLNKIQLFLDRLREMNRKGRRL